MTFMEDDQDRILVREVLVERVDRHAGALGNVVCRCGEFPLGEVVSSRIDDPLDGAPRSCLARRPAIVHRRLKDELTNMRTVQILDRMSVAAAAYDVINAAIFLPAGGSQRLRPPS